MFPQESLPLVESPSGHLLHQEVMAPFLSLQQAAKDKGVDLQIASSYRPVERQLLIWNAKWQGKRPLYDRSGKPLEGTLSDSDKLHSILTWSALPGASRHHWGTDLDVFDKAAIEASGSPLQLLDSEYTPGGPCNALYQFLLDKAREFGFYHVYDMDTGGVAPEKWHISHLATAMQYEQALSLEGLRDFIGQLDIAGKSLILEQLHDIYHRYIVRK